MHVIPQSCLVTAGLSLLVEIADKHTHTHTFAGFFKKEASSLSHSLTLARSQRLYALKKTSTNRTTNIYADKNLSSIATP